MEGRFRGLSLRVLRKVCGRMVYVHTPKEKFAIWLGIVGNLGLAVAKATCGLLGSSKSLVVDAIRSASCAAEEMARLAGLQSNRQAHFKSRSQKPMPLSAITVAVIFLLLGFEAGIDAIRTIASGSTRSPHWLAPVVAILSLGIGEWFFHPPSRAQGKGRNSKVLHGQRFHRVAAMLVVIGTGGAVAGVQLGAPQLGWLDPVTGVVLAGLLVAASWNMLLDLVRKEQDVPLDESEALELIQAIQRVVGVITVDELKAREHGYSMIVEVKICVNPAITVAEGHEIAKTARNLLLKRFVYLSDAIVHVSPYEPSYPYNNKYDAALSELPPILH